MTHGTMIIIITKMGEAVIIIITTMEKIIIRVMIKSIIITI